MPRPAHLHRGVFIEYDLLEPRNCEQRFWLWKAVSSCKRRDFLFPFCIVSLTLKLHEKLPILIITYIALHLSNIYMLSMKNNMNLVSLSMRKIWNNMSNILFPIFVKISQSNPFTVACCVTKLVLLMPFYAKNLIK